MLGFFVFLLCLVPSAHLAWQARDLPHLGLMHDDAIYAASARGLAAGHPYVVESLPWTPAQTKYPPLYPLYLSIAWRISPSFAESLALLLNWLWLPVFSAGAYRLLCKEGLLESQARWIAILLPLHPSLMLASTRLMSDLMYAALAVWSLALLPARAGLLVSCLAFLTRTAGLSLFVAISLPLALKRRWHLLAESLLSAGCVFLGWLLWSKWNHYPAQGQLEKYYTDYLGYQLEFLHFNQLPSHFAQQMIHFLAALSRGLLAIFPPAPLLSLLFCAISFAGIARLLRQRALIPYSTFALASMILLSIWYYRIDDRAVLPFLPLFFAGLITELHAFRSTFLNAWRNKGIDAAIVSLLAIVLFAYPLFALRHAIDTCKQDGYGMIARERSLRLAAKPAYDWIRSQTPTDAVFFALNDTELFFHTGRKALRIPDLDAIFLFSPTGQPSLSPATLKVLRDYKISCLFVSSNHLPDLPAPLDLNLSGSGFTPVFQSTSEIVACTK